MGVFVRAVVYGFGFSLGAALFKRVSSQLGFEEAQPATAQPARNGTADGDADQDDGGNDAAHAPA
jgi:hypothetical protein